MSHDLTLPYAYKKECIPVYEIHPTGGFTVGGGAESTPFSSGIAEFDENLKGIAQFRSTVRDGKLGFFSPEKRNLANIWTQFGFL